MFAERYIKEGEEMFISHIKSKDMGRVERQKTLMPWLGMACGLYEMCGRDERRDTLSPENILDFRST